MKLIKLKLPPGEFHEWLGFPIANFVALLSGPATTYTTVLLAGGHRVSVEGTLEEVLKSILEQATTE